MKLTDIAPLETWARIENESFEKFGMQSSVFNVDGVRITDTKNWSNQLCPEIKSTDKGQTFICATAHMNMANQARETRKPVIEECDAGLGKIVVPIFVGDEFVGTAAARTLPVYGKPGPLQPLLKGFVRIFGPDGKHACRLEGGAA